MSRMTRYAIGMVVCGLLLLIMVVTLEWWGVRPPRGWAIRLAAGTSTTIIVGLGILVGQFGFLVHRKIQEWGGYPAVGWTAVRAVQGQSELLKATEVVSLTLLIITYLLLTDGLRVYHSHNHHMDVGMDVGLVVDGRGYGSDPIGIKIDHQGSGYCPN